MTVEQENLLLRQLLWVWHGCPPGTQQGDDGELQCAGVHDTHRPIDFKRDAAIDIERSLQQPSLDFVHQHQDDRCRHCGVTRWTWEASRACTGGTHEWVSPPVEGWITS